MSQIALPGGPEEITPAWFTAVFRQHAILTSGAVVDAQTAIIGQDRGFTGVIVRARLQYAGCQETAPSSVVVKLPTAHRDTPSAYRASQEKDVTAARLYSERCAREVAFYQQMAPLIPLRVPHLYYGAVDTPTRTSVERDLLRRYHGLLLAGGVTGYDFSRLIEDCRLVLLWLLGAQIVWRGSLDNDNLSGREQDLVDNLTEESFAALLDYHAGSLLPL
ncbi:MAG TPA: hypothetical protein VJ761_22505 [Ktedonobacteraceae bacterium]|nr:hypothetical protein [Ktedonobacteraceae bacterium]